MFRNATRIAQSAHTARSSQNTEHMADVTTPCHMTCDTWLYTQVLAAIADCRTVIAKRQSTIDGHSATIEDQASSIGDTASNHADVFLGRLHCVLLHQCIESGQLYTWITWCRPLASLRRIEKTSTTQCWATFPCTH